MVDVGSSSESEVEWEDVEPWQQVSRQDYYSLATSGYLCTCMMYNEKRVVTKKHDF